MVRGLLAELPARGRNDGGARHAVERIPFESVTLRIVLTFNEIATLVVTVARTGIFLEQVVQHLWRRDGAGELSLLRRIGCLDVAGRIKHEGFMAQGAVCRQKPPDWVVAVFDATPPAVIDAR